MSVRVTRPPVPRLPQAREEGTEVLRYRQLTERQRRLLKRDFRRQILPALTPMAVGPGHPFPRLSNRSISLAVMLKQPGHGERFGSLTVPRMFPRRWRIPGQPESGKFVWLEELVAANIDSVFPGLEVLSTASFRVTRQTSEAAAEPPDRSRRERRRGRRPDSVLRLEVERSMPRSARDLLIQNIGIRPYQAVVVDGPLRSV